MEPKFEGWNQNGTNIQRLEPKLDKIIKISSTSLTYEPPCLTIYTTEGKHACQGVWGAGSPPGTAGGLGKVD